MKVKNFILMAFLTGAVLPSAVYADDYVDDIYFNPKTDTKARGSKKNSNYIENFGDVDVDAYNRRGEYYYTSPVDTIGQKTGSEEDFVYTQKIQKYYNPTIVLDNSDVLADVLANSYGNVEIVYNGFTPTFLPYYSYSYGWPYYRGWYDPWAWNIGFGGWYDPWYWGPSWSWGWGPSWSWGWGPSWNWGWGPGWNRPGWDYGWHPNATWSPGGNRPVRPNSGWAGNNRHPYNGQPGTAARPGSNNPSSGSNWSIAGNRRGRYTGTANSDKQNAAANRGGYYVGQDGHRYTGSGSNRYGGNSSVGNQRGTAGNQRGTTGNSYNTRRNSNSGNYNTNNSRTNNYNSNRTTNRSSYNTGRSSGNGSFGSGSFGGGSHRSGGGGGGRGHRR